MKRKISNVIVYSLLAILLIVINTSDGFIGKFSVIDGIAFILAPTMLIMGIIDIKSKKYLGWINVSLGIILFFITLRKFH
jgi:hypothetical protein